MSIIRIPRRGENFRFKRTYLDGTVGTELGQCSGYVYSFESLVAVTNHDDRTVWIDQVLPTVEPIAPEFREFFDMSHGGSTHECSPECTAVRYPR